MSIQVIPSSSIDPAAHTALSLAAGRTPDDVALPAGAIDVLASHGLIGAAALEGGANVAAMTKPAHFRLLMRQQVMDAHRRSIVELLDAEGIPSVVLKGRSVARWYERPDVRTSTDIDLLVPRDRVGQAVEAIGRYGSVTDVPPQGPEADKRHIMVRDETGVSFILDLHWHLFSYHQLRGRADTAMPEAWDRVQQSELGWSLPVETELAFLAAHSVLDHRFRLILFRDLAEVAKHRPDWDALVGFASRHGLRSVTWAALRTARRLASADVPDSVLGEFAIGSLPERAFERLLPRVDPVRFDGRSRHPLNLATVLLHDERTERLALAIRAPGAFERWKHKTETVHRKGPRRVLVLVTSNRRRGAEVFGEALSEALAARGWDVKFMSLTTGGGATVGANPVPGASPTIGRLTLSVIAGLRSAMQDVDVVLANGSATLRYSVAAASTLLSRPALVYSSIGEPAYWAVSAASRAIQRVLLSRVDLVGAVSQETQRQLAEHVGLDESVVMYAPTGVEIGSSQERSWNQEGPFRMVWVGSLSEEKRPLLLFDVLDRVDFPVSVDVVGDGPLMADVARRAAGDSRITVAGATDDVQERLRHADVLIQTSATEGLPGVVMEASSQGVPSVGFDVGGTRELIVDGVTGVLVKHDNIDAMVRALDEMNADRGAVRTMGDAARRHIAENFSLESAVDRWEEVLESAISRRRR